MDVIFESKKMLPLKKVLKKIRQFDFLAILIFWQKFWTFRKYSKMSNIEF